MITISDYIIDDELTDLGLTLPHAQQANIQSPGVRAAVQYEVITLAQALDLTPFQRREYEANFESTALREGIASDILDMKGALQLDHLQRANLESAGVRVAILDGVIDLGTALKLTVARRACLERPHLQAAIGANLITLDRACCLTEDQDETFRSELVTEIIACLNGYPEWNALGRRVIGQSLLGLHWCEVEFLESPAILAAIRSGLISIERAFKLTDFEHQNLQSSSVITLIRTGGLPLEEGLSLTEEQRSKLGSDSTASAASFAAEYGPDSRSSSAAMAMYPIDPIADTANLFSSALALFRPAAQHPGVPTQSLGNG